MCKAHHSDTLASWRGGKKRIEGACSEVACGAALVLPTKRELNSLELSIWEFSSAERKLQ